MENYSFNSQEIIHFLEKKIKDLYPTKSITEIKKEAYKNNTTSEILLFEDLSFIKTISKLTKWPIEWYKKLQNFDKYGIKIDIKITKVENIESNSESNIKFRESFFTYMESSLSLARARLGLNKFKHSTQKSSLKPQSVKDLFEKVTEKFDIDNDHVCNKNETFFIKDHVLNTQATTITLLNDEFDILDWLKVFRRETKDKTHLSEFYQIEYRKIYKGETPVEQLHADCLVILDSLGVDLSKIEIRKTRYTYVSPGFEVFYIDEDNNSLELCGMGIFRNEILKNYQRDSNDRYILAMGFGAQRLYLLKHKLKSLSDIYKVIK